MSSNADTSNYPPPPSYEEAQKYEVPSDGIGKTQPYPAGQTPYPPSAPPQDNPQIVAGGATPYPVMPGYVSPNQPSPYYQGGQAQPYPTQQYGQNMMYPTTYAGGPQGPYPPQGGIAPPPPPPGQTYPVAYGTAGFGPNAAAVQNAQKKRLIIFFVLAGIMIMVFIIIVTSVSSIH